MSIEALADAAGVTADTATNVIDAAGPTLAAFATVIRAATLREAAGIVASLCPEPGTPHAGDHCDYRTAATALTDRADKVVGRLSDV